MSRRVWWSAPVLFAAALAAGCPRTPVPTAAVPATAPAPPDPGPGWFRDVTAASGVAHSYRNGQEAGHLAILESLGGGVALLDYDGDGKLDIFLPGGGTYSGLANRDIVGLPSKLYRNRGDGTFADVTAAAGLDRPLFYTHGAAVADYDLDGWPDLLVTGWGRLALYHNEPDRAGGRRFADVTAPARLPGMHWATSAAWADFDGDGRPDLYVCQYVDWSFANHPRCSYHDTNLPDVCPPAQFKALPHALFRNTGDGTFAEVGEAAGLSANGARDRGKGLGVVAADFDGDGRPDVYVADDTTDNLLYLNRGGGKFEETGRTAGVATDDLGVPNGSMGVAVGDPDGAGRPWLFVTNYQKELHALYRNDGGGLFTFVSQPSGMAAVGRQHIGFGAAFADLDRDGWEDLVFANGHVIRHPTGTTVAQQPVLLRNEGRGRFGIVTDRGGEYFRTPHHGRGLAAGDLDNDGRIDLVVSNVNEPAAVLRNETPDAANWVGVELVGAGRRDVVGARVALEAGGRKQYRFAVGGGSYLSSGDRRLVFGLGAERPGRVTVEWPSGEPRRQDWDGLAAGRYHRLVQGEPAAR